MEWNKEELDAITRQVLAQIDTENFGGEGAYNLRYNGTSICHGDTEHIKSNVRLTARELMCISARKRRGSRYTFR